MSGYPYRRGGRQRWLRACGILLALAVAALWTAPAAPAAGTQVTWYGQAAFKVVTPNGGVIFIDPWLKNPKNPDKETLEKVTRADYILITHGHGDHVGQSVELAKKTGAKLVAAAGLARNMVDLLGFPKDQAPRDLVGNIGGTMELKGTGARVTLVAAIHSSEIALPKEATHVTGRVTSGNPIGLVLQIDGGPTIYHTGDTDVFGDMRLIGKLFDVDLMLACIGGHFTMDPKRAAVAVKMVNPATVVPMHYGTFGLLAGTPDELKAALAQRKSRTNVVVMNPGDTRTF